MFNYIRLILSSLFIFISLSSFAADSPFKSNHFIESISSASDVASGDLNGDGYVDIFVVSDRYRHQVYFNNSQTIFKPSEQSFSTIGGSKVIIADFDNDGDLDAWVGLLTNTYDQIYLNDGSGHFDLVDENITNMTEFSTKYIVAADIDNDSDIDMIRSTFSGTRFLYRNNGKGGFTEESQSIYFTHAAMGDYDGDGFLDLWTINGNLTVFLNDQSGLFDDSRKIIDDSGMTAIDITVADIDDDGDLDVQGYTESFRLDPSTGFPVGSMSSLPRYINNSDGTFIIQSVGQFVNTGSSNVGLLIDFNGDENLDLWTAGIEGRTTNVIATNEGGLLDYNNVLVFDNEQERYALTQADFDNDGDSDVLSVGLSGGINLWLNQDSFNFAESEQPILNIYTGSSKGLVATDVNLDGNMDYISADTNGISLYLGNGRLNFEHLSLGKGEGYSDIVAKDFNNDGYPDFVVVGSNPSELWINNQNNTFSKTQQSDFAEAHYVVDAADYDQDGDQDLLFMQLFGKLEIWENDGQASFSLQQTISSSFLQAKFVEMDNDNKIQLLTVDLDEFTFDVLYEVFDFENTNFIYNPIYTKRFFGILGTSFTNLLTFDWDGDGDMDVMTGKNTSSGRSILINNGDLGFEVLDIPISTFRIYAVDDFNNDGSIDFIGSSNYVFINDGQNNFTSVAPNIPLNIYEMILTDFDNDGDLDMVSRSFEGLQNNANTTIDQDFSGLWYNPEQSGHGLQIEELFVQGNQQIFMSWYVYQNGIPVWLSGLGTVINNRAEVDVIITEGTGFQPDFNASDVNRIPWGTLTVDFIDKNNLNFNWDTNITGFSDGSMSMQRLTSVSEVGINITGIRSCHSGSWYNTDQSGHGFMVEVVGSTDDQRLMLTWYTYLNGEQYWMLAQGDIVDNKAILTAKSGAGGNFPPNFDSSDVDFGEWGDITFELIDDTNARVSWDSVNSSFSSGQLDVSKLTYIDRYDCN